MKNPIANVRQITDKNPKKIKFSFMDEDLFGLRVKDRESLFVFLMIIDINLI